MPRFRTETLGGGDQSWLGSTHGIANARTGTLDVSTFTKETHYPDDYVRSGTPVNVADESAVAPWTGAAGERLGFVLTDTPVGSPAVDTPAPILLHGVVKVANLPVDFDIPVTAAAGATGFVFVGGETEEVD